MQTPPQASAKAVLGILPRAREQRYGQEAGRQWIAIPVFDRFWPRDRRSGVPCAADTKSRCADLLKEAGRAISAHLGYHGGNS
jgi:IclR family KDG regulon transcriptional repressor